MKKLSITILPEEMNYPYHSTDSCPLALAIIRQLGVEKVSAGGSYVTIFLDSKYVDYYIDEEWGPTTKSICQKENKGFTVKLTKI